MKSLWVVLVLMPLVLGGSDWPVFFELLGNVNSIHNKWELTFSIDTNFDYVSGVLEDFKSHVDKMRPEAFRMSDEERKSEEKQRKTEGPKSEESKLRHRIEDHWDKVTEILVRRSQNLKKKLEDTMALGDNRIIREIRGSKGKKKRNNRRKEDPVDLKEEAANFRRTTKNKKKSSKTNKRGKSGGRRGGRSKRQAGGASGLLQLLFGVAYTDNVRQLEDQLSDMERRLNADVANIVNTYNNGKNTLERRISDTQTKIHDMEQMTEEMEEKVKDMDLERRLGKGNLMEETTVALQELTTELSECELFIIEVDKMIGSLSGGRLSPAIVPARVLQRHLEEIESRLPPTFTLLYPSSESLWPYYSVISTSIYFSKDFQEMFVHISVPLSDKGNNMQLFRVHNLPLKVRDGFSVTADIDTEYLLVARGGEYHLELKKEDFQDCQTYQKDGQQFYCGFKPLLQSAKHETCVIQLFNMVGDRAMCQSRLNHGLVQPFNRLYNGSWVFAALATQVPVVMQCPNTSTPTSLLGFGVINLMEGCTLSSLEYMYPQTFSGYSDVSLTMSGGSGASSGSWFGGSSSIDPDSELTGNGLHQIGFVDDYDTSFQTEIISAVVAEEDDDEGVEGANFIAENENYLPADYFNGRSTELPPTVTTTMMTTDAAEAVTVMDDDGAGHEPKNATLITRQDFEMMENGKGTNGTDADDVVLNVVNNVLNLVPESPEDHTEVHHEVLVKLRDKIAQGKHWLEEYSKRRSD